MSLSQQPFNRVACAAVLAWGIGSVALADDSPGPEPVQGTTAKAPAEKAAKEQEREAKDAAPATGE